MFFRNSKGLGLSNSSHSYFGAKTNPGEKTAGLCVSFYFERLEKCVFVHSNSKKKQTLNHELSLNGFAPPVFFWGQDFI